MWDNREIVDRGGVAPVLKNQRPYYIDCSCTLGMADLYKYQRAGMFFIYSVQITLVEEW